jgi:molybdopterin-containing oxidoreductase family iron-sulfur binding subunit
VPDDDEQLIPADGLDRRGFLKLVAASAALAGCDHAPPSKLYPFNTRPEDVTPGRPTWYATTLALDGYATGVLVRADDGRPTKIEGNPRHPASLGATGMYEQAAVLGLYDPGRARAARDGDLPSTWAAIAARLAGPRDDRGARLRLLLRPESSPLVAAQLARVKARWPAARVTFWAPLGDGEAAAGARLAFGRALSTVYDFGAAPVVVSLDADFAGAGPFCVRYARQLADARRVAQPGDAMARLYVVEPAPTATGSLADHRVRARGSEVAAVAAALALELDAIQMKPGNREKVTIQEKSTIREKATSKEKVAIPGKVALPPDLRAQLERGRARDPWIAAAARDLARAGGLVVVGPRQPAEVHALAHALNAALGARASSLVPPVLLDGDQPLAELTDELAAGAVDTLLIVDGDPVRDAPADLDFGAALDRVARSLYLGVEENDTALRCRAFVPAAHPLEAWGDARALDGTRSLAQPVIAPLHGGRTAVELLAALAGDRFPDARRLLRASFAGGDAAWRDALADGVVDGSASPPLHATPRPLRHYPQPPTVLPALELCFAPSATLYDGRFATNPWLLEQPDPITKLTWDNAALLGARTAARLGIDHGDDLELTVGGAHAILAALVVPGHAEGCATVAVGWGRARPDAPRARAGVDVYPLRRAAAPWFAAAGVRRTGGATALARTQRVSSQLGRAIAPSLTRDEYRTDPDRFAELRAPVPSLMAPWPASGDQWAMTIDTGVCTGCSACEVACRAENNVLVVGKREVLRGREMHWLRIDTYWDGPPDDPRPIHQPMLCQHCEKAPCEYVCPVNATEHSSDGLNEMIYNRCIGTRFCSNNCPYKVRRFNWFRYDERAPNDGLARLQRNPQVSVRQRGVMEKCTYCVQRIRSVEIEARLAARAVRPGEVVTACQQACPTRAITFGSLAHADSDVVAWRDQPRAYAALHDEGTRPRTMYLARVTNPNPELV